MSLPDHMMPPNTDATTGVGYYTTDIDTLAENPPNLLLNPRSFVSVVDQEGRPGLGPPNAQLFQSGETNAEPINPADSQGEGRPPGLQWGHYPHVQQFNDMRLVNNAFLDGQDPTPLEVGGGGRDPRSPIWPEGYLHYTQFPDQHHVWPHVAVVNQPDTPAFTELVPALDESGGGW